MLARSFLSQLLAVLALLLASAGCDNLREFKTGPGSVFRGEVTGSDSAPETSSFIRTGFASHTRMELVFDPYANNVADEDALGRESAGSVHTYVCPASRRDCSAREGTTGPFDQASLQSIENLTHDALSEYTFPGGGRLRNYMFNVRFTSELAADRTMQRNAMLFLSLMDSGQVEVRAIAPSVLGEDGEGDRLPALFGVFVLDRQPR